MLHNSEMDYVYALLPGRRYMVLVILYKLYSSNAQKFSTYHDSVRDTHCKHCTRKKKRKNVTFFPGHLTGYKFVSLVALWHRRRRICCRLGSGSFFLHTNHWPGWKQFQSLSQDLSTILYCGMYKPSNLQNFKHMINNLPYNTSPCM